MCQYWQHWEKPWIEFIKGIWLYNWAKAYHSDPLGVQKLAMLALRTLKCLAIWTFDGTEKKPANESYLVQIKNVRKNAPPCFHSRRCRIFVKFGIVGLANRWVIKLNCLKVLRTSQQNWCDGVRKPGRRKVDSRNGSQVFEVRNWQRSHRKQIGPMNITCCVFV